MLALMGRTIDLIIKYLYVVLVNFIVLLLFAFVNAQVCIVGVEPFGRNQCSDSDKDFLWCSPR